MLPNTASNANARAMPAPQLQKNDMTLAARAGNDKTTAPSTVMAKSKVVPPHLRKRANAAAMLNSAVNVASNTEQAKSAGAAVAKIESKSNAGATNIIEAPKLLKCTRCGALGLEPKQLTCTKCLKKADTKDSDESDDGFLLVELDDEEDEGTDGGNKMTLGFTFV